MRLPLGSVDSSADVDFHRLRITAHIYREKVLKLNTLNSTSLDSNHRKTSLLIINLFLTVAWVFMLVKLAWLAYVIVV